MSNYYEQLPKFPVFEIMINDEDGRIPVCYIDSWKMLPEILNDDFFRQHDKELVFRGQEDYRWGLTPSLGRLNRSGTIETKIAEKHKEHFRLSIRGRVDDSNMLDDDIELWALGQHNGLKTPLLDWTYSPYIALFFAFERDDSLEEEKESRAIYILNKKALEELDNELFVQPRRNDHVRLINQAGLFTISPRDTSDTLETHILSLIEREAGVNMDNPSEVAYFICKIHIPNTDKVACIQHLRMMNIHQASLFPDLMGSSEYCNTLISEVVQKEEKVIEEEAVNFNGTSKDFGEYKENKYRDHEDQLLDNDFIDKYFIEALEKYELSTKELKHFIEDLKDTLERRVSIDWYNRDNIIATLKVATRLKLRHIGLSGDELELADSFINSMVEYEKTERKS